MTCIEESRADSSWLGQPLTTSLLAEFAARGIDVCGERSKYHTLAVNGPRFAHRLSITLDAIHSEASFRQIDTHS